MEAPSCPPALLKGIDQFNRQEFFQCHETLEHLWQAQKDREREFTQGIIQIAVAYHHLLAGNREGAVKLFEKGLRRVMPFSPCFFGMDVDSFTRSVSRDLELARKLDYRPIDKDRLARIAFLGSQ
jgi:uncharacterized protein